MKNKIKELRVRIDGLAQLTKQLKPFEWINVVIENTNSDDKCSGIIQMDDEASENPGSFGNFKYHSLIKTDKGVFRLGSNKYKYPNLKYNFNQNSKQIEKAVDSLYLAKAWLGKMLGELQEKEFIIEPLREYEFTRARSINDQDTYIRLGKDLTKQEHDLLYGEWLNNNTSPYKNDGNRKTVNDIEPTADIHKGILHNPEQEETPWREKSHIEKVDWLREQIKDIIDNTEDFSKEHDYIELEQGFVYKYLSEARFWLGFELQRINEKLQ